MPNTSRGELRIDLGQLRRHHLPHQPQRLGRWRRRLRHVGGPVEIEAGVLDHLGDRVAGMHACEPEAPRAASNENRQRLVTSAIGPPVR